jgi:hypothetical protein
MIRLCAGLVALLSLGAVGFGNPYDMDAVLEATIYPFPLNIDSAYLIRAQESFAYPTPGWGVHWGHLSDTFYFPGYPYSWAWRVWLKGTADSLPFRAVIDGPENSRWYYLPILHPHPPYVMFADFEDPGVEEPGGAVAPLQCLTVSPSVVTGLTTVRLQPVGTGRPVVQMHDAVGNVVRSLDCTAGADGIASATWNREDDRGRLVPQGIYFCRYAAADAIAARKILVAH